MVKWLLTGVPRPFNGARTVFSTNGAEKTGYPDAKEWSWTLTYTKINSKCIKKIFVGHASDKMLIPRI